MRRDSARRPGGGPAGRRASGAPERGLPLPRGNDFLRVVAVSPAPRAAAMAGLGFHFLLRAAASAGARVDRLFLEPPPDPPRGVDTGLLPRESDLVAVTAAWERDLLALPGFLRSSGIPPLSRDRSVADPLVALGGPLTLLNPRAVEACVDLVCAGDGDEALPALLARLGELKSARAGRAETLAELARIPNFHRPPLAGPLEPAAAPCRTPVRSVATSAGYAFGDLHLVELSRGCPCRCRFCAMGALPGTARHFPLAAILEAVEAGRRDLGAKRFGLVGAAALSHPELPGLLDELIRRDATAAFSSLYAERVDAPLAARLARLDVRTVTFGLESGLPGLRRAAGKPEDEAVYLDAAGRLCEAGIRRFKFYAIARMPGAPDAEEEAAALAGFLDRLRAARPEIRELSVSINPFVPKPRSAWERAACAGPEFARFLATLRSHAPRGTAIQSLPLSEARLETCIDRAAPLSDDLLDPPDRPAPAEQRRRLERALLERAGELCGELAAGAPPWPELGVAPAGS